MNGWRDSSWPTQAPSADFAARTAARLLRDRALAAPEASDLSRTRRRRWPLALLAAVTVSATAWGTFALRQPAVSPPASAPASPPAETAPVPRRSGHAVDGVEPPSAPTPRVELPARTPLGPSAPRRPATRPVSGKPSPAAEPETAPPPRAPVRTPRCECGPGGVVCSCIE